MSNTENASPTDFMEVAIQAARSAGEFIASHKNKISQLKISEKSLHDYVSEVDRQSEKIISDFILTRFPEHALLGEEHGQQGKLKGEQKANLRLHQWVVDPLDGTTNFLRSIPHYAVSIALLIDGRPEVAVVYDPVKQDLFQAQKGRGALLNGETICVKRRAHMQGSLLATGVPFSGRPMKNIASFTACMQDILAIKTSGIRRLGAAALDLAYVACGRYDGYWESGLQSWDIAAGILLVTEAGGTVTDLRGNHTYFETGDVLAASPNVHGDMLSVTAKHYS